MNKNRNVTVRAPITMVIGPVPSEVEGPSGLFSFGLAHMTNIFAEKNIKAHIEGEQVIATFSINDEVAKSQTARGLVLDDRAYRILPAGERHDLQISLDLGKTFSSAATFIDYDFARAVGDAWVDGRVENFE